MILGVEDHRADGGIRRPGASEEGRGRGRGAVPGPPREDLGQAGDVGLRVGGKRPPRDVALGRAVRVQLEQADGHELHDLARIVLVRRTRSGRILLHVAQVGQVAAHHGAQRDRLEDVPVIAEGVGGERVVVGAGAEGIDHVGGQGDHEDLGISEGDPLPELVGSGDGGAPPGVEELVRVELGVGIGLPHLRQLGLKVGLVRNGRRRRADLAADPGLGAAGADGVNVGLGGAKGSLGQEAAGLGLGRTCYGRRPGTR